MYIICTGNSHVHVHMYEEINIVPQHLRASAVPICTRNLGPVSQLLHFRLNVAISGCSIHVDIVDELRNDAVQTCDDIK